MRILIWHGDIETVARWQTAFGVAGHLVRRAISAEAAMDSLRTESFDMLLFDLMVGRESGLAVALMAEFHHPQIVSLLIVGEPPRQHSEVIVDSTLFARLASLRCVLGVGTPVMDLIAIAEEISHAPDADCAAISQSTPQICDNCHVRTSCTRMPERSNMRSSSAAENGQVPDLSVELAQRVEAGHPPAKRRPDQAVAHKNLNPLRFFRSASARAL